MAGVRADNGAMAAPLPTPGTVSPPHLTDEQDRLMSGELGPNATDKSCANAHYAEALLQLEDPQGNPQKALGQLRQVVTLDPHYTDAQIKIANLLLQGGQVESALEQLKTALAANPNSVAIEAALAYTQRLHGENDEALRLSTDALAKDPNQSVAMRVLLEIAGDKGDLAADIPPIEAILKADGPSVPASAWLTLARLYVEMARNDTRSPAGQEISKTLLPIYQQAAAQNPPEVQTLSLLSDTYRNLGQKRAALETLQKAGALEPSNVDIILRCADLETELGQKAGALKDYEEAYALNPSLTGLREMLGRLYLDNSRFEDAARLLQEALLDSPDSPDLMIDLGIAYQGAHRQDQAKTFFQRAFDSKSSIPETYLKLARFELSEQQVGQAGETLVAAQTRFPTSAEVRFYQAIQCRYAKKYNDAIACLAEARALASGSTANLFDIDFYLESALAMSLANRKDLIESTLREGLAKYPDNPDLMNELAYFWADQGSHLSDALALTKRAAQLDPDNGPLQDTWGWIYFRMGEAGDALPYLQRAALMTNNDPVVLQHLGDAYSKLGRQREAIDAWRCALEKAPGNHELARRIDAATAQATHAHLRSAPNK